MMLENVTHYGPVTSLALEGDLLYVGQGPMLRVFNWKESLMVGEGEIFKRNNIHGICSDGARIAVWGGQSFAFLSRPDFYNGSAVVERQVNDWISYLVVSGKIAYIQTAHNKIHVIQIDDLVVTASFECEEKSVLYSGTILPLGSSTLVAAGTVLGGVVVWDLESQTVLHTMTSHEGSIFGVRFSPDGRFLASCSDDRSIRLWDVNTGAQVAVGWGHVSRIWQLRFHGDKIISVSEDCTARVWACHDKELVCEQILEGHQGRNIWCQAVQDDVLVTGGGDGRVRVWDLREKPDLSDTKQVWSLDNSKEFHKTYALVGDWLIATTSAGRVLARKEDWIELEMKVDTYSMVKPLSRTRACVATRDGRAYIVEVGDTARVVGQFLVSFKGQVSELLVLTAENPLILFQTKNPSDPFLIYDENGTLRAELLQPSQFHATSCHYAPYDRQYPLNGRVYLGSRLGDLAVFEVDFNIFNRQVEPHYYWRNVMSEDAVTSVVCVDGAVQLTSRSGHYAVVTVNDDICIRHIGKLPRGGIENCQIVSGKTIFYGFRNDLFFIWNETDEYEIMSERCGGSHRSWALDFVNENEYTLVYTKVSNLVQVSRKGVPKFSKTLLQTGVHGREIRGAVFCPKVVNGTRVLATAAEDTLVRLSTVNLETGKLTTGPCYGQHISGIQSLHWSEDGEYLISSGAVEELIFWKVYNGKRLYAAPVANLPTISDIPDLRIMNFVTRKLSQSKYLVVTVYSDSAIRVWELENMKFRLVSSGVYRKCCLLNCELVTVGEKTFLAVSSTDGHLAIWSWDAMVIPTSLGPPLSRIQLHQSSVKSSFITKLAGRYLHVSGGDDNAVVIAELDFENVDGKVLVREADAHSCTITAVCPVEKDDVRVRFITAGTDQIVKMWSFDGALCLETARYTTVADTGVVDVSDRLAAVGGSGLSIWRVEAD
jgi:WD40 repeat protein